MIIATDLVLIETSPSVEIYIHYLGLLQNHFLGSKTVEVDGFMEDFNPDVIEHLHNRAMKATQCLFDVARIDPVINEDKRKSNTRIDEDVITFGWYIVSSSLRDDKGIERKLEALNTIHRVKRVMSNNRVTITTDRNGNTKTVLPRLSNIEKLQSIKSLAIYQMMYDIKITTDLLISGF